MTSTNATDLSKKTQRCSITPTELDTYMSNVSILTSYVQLLKMAIANHDNAPVDICTIEAYLIDISDLTVPILEISSEIFSVIKRVHNNEK